VLVLDEPTNDLDIETLELLEMLLRDYSGTLFLVSHDREFLDNVVTQVIAFEGNGRLQEHVGGYEDWMRSRRIVETKTTVQKKINPVKSTATSSKPAKPASRSKLGYHETRELEALPAKIEALENEQAQISLRLSDTAIYRDSPEEAKGLQERFSAIERELMACFDRWNELETKCHLEEIHN
jgi:ATP-binding cassette subfamily F protein uup